RASRSTRQEAGVARSDFVARLALSLTVVFATTSHASAQASREIHVGEAEKTDESVVRLTGPGTASLKKGTVLDIFEDSPRVVYLPLTHGEEALVREQRVVASLVVIDVSRDSVRGKIFSPEGVHSALLKNKLA